MQTDIEALFHAYAREAALDKGKLDACLEDNSVLEEIRAGKDSAKSMGIQSTPTFFFNGKMVVGVRAMKEELDTYFPEEKNS